MSNAGMDMNRDVLGVIQPGLSTTIQDKGRFGSQRFGVSVSGAIDVVSLAMANHLVGNDTGAAALEMTMTGGIYEVLEDAVAVAITGADMPLSAGGRVLAPNETHIVRRGERLEVGPARCGLRAYLAVAGGIAVAPVLGSRSTHLRSALGGLDGRTLQPGARLPGSLPSAMPERLRLKSDRRPYFGGVVRILAGPQDDAFKPHALEVLTGGRYRVSVHFDRMGAKLDGPPLPFRDGFNIVSDGIVAGSIQVPGDGRPLVLLADRQTTGGYPKIATVTTPDLCRIGQRRPNERVQFHLVSPDEAEEAYIRWAGYLDRIPEYFDRLPWR
jgi:biotin-dependent carboxylase-like uncharacterized protein